MSSYLRFIITVLTSEEIALFRSWLIEWYEGHRRDLPWRRTRDPYRVWVSEIMLQQTRVTAAIPYYERFLARYPTLQSLAESGEGDLLAHWAGLGYYHRARNMREAAKVAVAAGGFPVTYERIRELPGVGDYTAAAVASISFRLPHAVVDGNVFRVLSRVLADDTDIASGAGKKRFGTMAQALLDPLHPGEYNQAIMELGATVCLPKNPQCLLCPVANLCTANAAGRQNEFPVKGRGLQMKEEHRTVLWIERGGHVLLWQRPPHATLMPGFWELPEPEHLPNAIAGNAAGVFRHGITFHKYLFTVMRAELESDTGTCRWIEKDHLTVSSLVPVSTIVRKASRVIAKSAKQSRTAGA